MGKRLALEQLFHPGGLDLLRRYAQKAGSALFQGAPRLAVPPASGPGEEILCSLPNRKKMTRSWF